jgi:hypothetical protein
MTGRGGRRPGRPRRRDRDRRRARRPGRGVVPGCGDVEGGAGDVEGVDARTWRRANRSVVGGRGGGSRRPWCRAPGRDRQGRGGLGLADAFDREEVVVAAGRHRTTGTRVVGGHQAVTRLDARPWPGAARRVFAVRPLRVIIGRHLPPSRSARSPARTCGHASCEPPRRGPDPIGWDGREPRRSKASGHGTRGQQSPRRDRIAVCDGRLTLRTARKQSTAGSSARHPDRIVRLVLFAHFTRPTVIACHGRRHRSRARSAATKRTARWH